MAPFIKFTDSESNREKFVSVLYVSSADFDEESGELNIGVNEGGVFHSYVLRGKEATDALRVLNRRRA